LPSASSMIVHLRLLSADSPVGILSEGITKISD
jgi:hypothetical protein